MESLLNLTVIADFLSSSLRMAVPLTFATIGGMMSERCAVYNIGLEGMILLGAFGAAVGAFLMHTPFGGVFLGVLLGMCGGLFLAVLAVSLRVNQLVAGIAINMFHISTISYYYPTKKILGIGHFHDLIILWIFEVKNGIKKVITSQIYDNPSNYPSLSENTHKISVTGLKVLFFRAFCFE